VDLDCDGVITPNEMQFFYEEQLHRMECMAQEPVLFEDIVCQMADMICPHVRVFMLFNHSSPWGQDGELTDYSECQLACLEQLFLSLFGDYAENEWPILCFIFFLTCISEHGLSCRRRVSLHYVT
jgi:hypothetical protein